MANDTLSLGGIVFDDFATPESMPFGGKQAMAVHKLPGGARVIDTLGPDEDDITFSGQWLSPDAHANALALDAMRQAGQPVPLIWGGGYRTVIISEFKPVVHRFPMWVSYTITLVVADNPMLGGLGAAAGGIGDLIASDLSAALGI